MITRFSDSTGAVEEACYRADAERCVQCICGDDVGFRVLPYADAEPADVFEIFRPREQM